MSIFRLLLIAAALYLLWRLGRVLLKKLNSKNESEPQYLPTVACARCATHVPPDTLSPSGLCGKCSARP